MSEPLHVQGTWIQMPSSTGPAYSHPYLTDCTSGTGAEEIWGLSSLTLYFFTKGQPDIA